MKEMFYTEDGQTYKVSYSQQLQQQTVENLKANQELYKKFILLAYILILMMGIFLMLFTGTLLWLDKTNFLSRILAHL